MAIIFKGHTLHYIVENEIDKVTTWANGTTYFVVATSFLYILVNGIYYQIKTK